MAVLDGSKSLGVYAREDKEVLTGLGIVRKVEVAIKPGKSVSQYLEATYVVQEFERKEKATLEKALKKIEKRDGIKIDYAIHNVRNEKFRKMGLTKQILVPFAGTREGKNFQHISEVNRALKFKDYDENEVLEPENEKYLEHVFSDGGLV